MGAGLRDSVYIGFSQTDDPSSQFSQIRYRFRVVSSIVFCCWSYLRNCIKMVIVYPNDYDDWTMTILIWMMGGGGRGKDGGGISHRVVN